MLEGYGNSLDVTVRTHFTQQLFQPPSDGCFCSYLATIHVDSPTTEVLFFKIPGVPLEYVYGFRKKVHKISNLPLHLYKTILNHSFMDSNERTWYLSSRGLRIAIPLRKTYVGKKKKKEEH